jgi:hypothetical protein
MLLRGLDAFEENDRYIKKFSTIAIVGTAARAAACSITFTRSKGSGPDWRGLQTADTSVRIR